MQPTCPLCGSSESEKLRSVTHRDDYLDLIGMSYDSLAREWLQCESCHHVHNSIRLSPQELVTLYERFRDQEWRKESPDEYFDRITALPSAQSENSQKISILKQAAGWRNLSQGGAVIDIGCGGGVLLHTAKKVLGTEWNFYGVEPTPSFAELGARRTGAKVINGNFKAGLFPGIKFELAMCCQVLEHLNNPVEFMGEIRKDFTDDGLPYLKVPDISDFQTLPQDHDRFMVQHISYFSHPILQSLLTRSSFKILDSGVMTTVRGRNNLWLLARAA